MRGFTNAQGITGPHLANMLERLSLLENNPPVGSVTTFAGFDWVVVHWDTNLKRMYLMLKDIYTKTTWADSPSEHTPYESSNVKAELLNFENLLGSRLFTNSVFFERFDLPIVKGKDSYAFIPTKTVAQGFCFFQQTATALDDSGVSFCGNAIIVTGDSGNSVQNGWWLSNSAPADDECWYVDAFGRFLTLGDSSRETDSNYQHGVRPFICMKMR